MVRYYLDRLPYDRYVPTSREIIYYMERIKTRVTYGWMIPIAVTPDEDGWRSPVARRAFLGGERGGGVRPPCVPTGRKRVGGVVRLFRAPPSLRRPAPPPAEGGRPPETGGGGTGAPMMPPPPRRPRLLPHRMKKIGGGGWGGGDGRRTRGGIRTSGIDVPGGPVRFGCRRIRSRSVGGKCRRRVGRNGSIGGVAVAERRIIYISFQAR